uniref:Cilia- and flagella-associated protein 61 N-terminal domain-containing protein n=1 Tax=Erpetoichthys calabaricus TaxID=27687 RepID=A0A8C4RSV4_ERPCA
MSAVASLSSSEEVITSRRTESLDAHEISKLITPSTTGMFGRINGKSNLAVSLENENKEIVAHAAFLDYPNHSLTDPAEWGPLDSKIVISFCFFFFFIYRTVSQCCPELHYIFLFIPSIVSLGKIFAFAYKFRFRVEDHDDLIPLFTQHNSDLSAMYGDYFLAELIEAQNEQNHAVVCEVRGKAVGFMSVCSDVNVEMLNQCFNLKPFHGLYVPDPADILEPPPELEENQSGCYFGFVFQKEAIITPDADIPAKGDTTHNLKYSSGICMEEAEKKIFHPVYKGSSDAFCIQLFVIDEKYEMRYSYQIFMTSIPNMVPEFPLLQSFARVIPYHSSTLPQDLYFFFICFMITIIFLQEGTPVQAFVAEVMDQIVGIGIIKNEEDINYIRSHYNIEDFIYFSYHTQEEHGRLLHFALNPIFHHHRKHFLKEILRLSYKSCIYHTVNHQQEQDKVKYHVFF